MSLSYDEILSDNVFGQIIAPAPNSSQQSTSSITNNNINNNNNGENMTEDTSKKSLDEEFGFSIEELFTMGRSFLKGNSNLHTNTIFSSRYF